MMRIFASAAVVVGLAVGIAAGTGTTARDAVKAAMAKRPNDPWPRGKGHVVIAMPGTRDEEKGYLEPGGSLSPAVGTFGVSFWVIENAQLKTTGDAIPMEQIEQRFEWDRDAIVPPVVTTTPYYRARWLLENYSWTLDLDAKADVEVVIRSVGPAGGPITSLEWDDKQLHINSVWTVEPPNGAVLTGMGEEGSPGWLARGTAPNRWEGAGGWGYARLRMPRGKSFLVIHGANPALAEARAVPLIRVDTPDDRFNDCLRSQIANLSMSIVDGETRPGDPMNYPLAWLRDGTYTLTALARSGRIDLAFEVARKFAEDDFFGGFGSEADAPGLSLWALEEVASRVADEDFDLYLWPHVQRKASLILEMMHATKPVRRPYSGPIVPAHQGKPDLDLVAGPARDGLIDGRMDHHHPLLFVNAVSYRGLLSAAELADRMNAKEKAEQYRAAAKELQQAWIRGFHTKERDNERTFISALWPTGIGTPVSGEVREALAARDPLKEPPLWTYFTIAEAHQWLRLGEPEKAWTTMRWFWDHQASPGMYTWWEGSGEENTFHRWEQVRGWISPPYVTPHYWSAAEMLLLQLEMLTYLDGDTLVIGAGVQKEWLEKKIVVKGLPFGGKKVDWEWDGKRLKVDQHGAGYKLRNALVRP
jgi:hypothetical protein